MKFVDLLNEKWYDTIKATKSYNKRSTTVDVFINPSMKEIKEMERSASYGGGVRLGITDEKNPKVYAWRGDIIHDVVKDKIKFDFGARLNRGEYDMIYSDMPTGMFGDNWKTFNRLKHKDEVLKALKKLFPKAKELATSFSGIKL